MKSLEKFIEETKGTAVDFPEGKLPTNLKGQCVTLVQNYIFSCLGQPYTARGNAKDWIKTYVEEDLGTTSSEQRDGDIIVFPNEADGYGHIGVWFEGKIYDQNNARHDNGKAGLCNIFSWDFVTLHPNVEVQVYEPKNDVQYLNLSNLADTWRVYTMDVAPVVGNECKELLPSKFGGLSYTIKGYTQENVAIIETRDFGEVQIYIGKDVSNMFSISSKPIYQLVK